MTTLRIIVPSLATAALAAVLAASVAVGSRGVPARVWLHDTDAVSWSDVRSAPDGRRHSGLWTPAWIGMQDMTLRPDVLWWDRDTAVERFRVWVGLAKPSAPAGYYVTGLEHETSIGRAAEYVRTRAPDLGDGPLQRRDVVGRWDHGSTVRDGVLRLSPNGVVYRRHGRRAGHWSLMNEDTGLVRLELRGHHTIVEIAPDGRSYMGHGVREASSYAERLD